MAAHIRLEDGRGLCGSSLSIDAMLHMIAEHVSDEASDFRAWLADKASRPAPFQDTDLGGLGPPLRREFYDAAERAYSAYLRKDPSLGGQGGVQLLGRLLAMRSSIDRGEPPEALSDFEEVLEPRGMEDIGEVWGL